MPAQEERDELVAAVTVRDLLRCLEAEVTRIIVAWPIERDSRLLRLRMVLFAGPLANLPMVETIRQVCAALESPPPMLR
jgi:hypothetical protein